MTASWYPPLLALLPLIPAVAAGFFQQWSALSAALVLIWAAIALPVWRDGRARLDRADLLALAWLLWLPLTLIWSHVGDFSQAVVFGLAMLPAGFLVWRRWPHAERAWPWTQGLLWLLAGGLAAWGMLQDPAATYTGKPEGPYIDPNVYAATLNLLWLPLTAFYLRARAQRPRWIEGAMLLVLGLLATAFFMSASRGAGLAALILFPLIFWHARRQAGYTERVLKWLILAALGYGIALLAMDQDVGGRLAETVRSGDSARMLLWQSTWQMIVQQPWLGWGFGSFRLLYPAHRDPLETGSAGYWSHNDYLQIWQEGGLISLLLVLAFALVMVRTAWRALRAKDNDAGERLGLMAGCLAIWLHAGVNFLLYFPTLGLLMGIYWARALATDPRSSQARGYALAIRPAVGRTLWWGTLMLSGYVLVTSAVINSGVLFTRSGETVLGRLVPASHHAAIAHWLAILRPTMAQPRLTLAALYDQRLGASGTGDSTLDAQLFAAADAELTAARQALPCLVTLGVMHMEFLLRHRRFANAADPATRAVAIAHENLACHPRHGLSHAYLARAQHALGDKDAAQATLREAYGKVLYQAEQYALIATWLEIKSTPAHPETVDTAHRIRRDLFVAEYYPARKIPQRHWDEQFQQIDRLARSSAP